LTFILIYGSIFNSIRPKKDPDKKWTWLFHCTLCMGFWVSAFLFCINDYTELFTFEYSLGNMFCLSCLGSGTTYMLSMIVDDFGLIRTKGITPIQLTKHRLNETSIPLTQGVFSFVEPFTNLLPVFHHAPYIVPPVPAHIS